MSQEIDTVLGSVEAVKDERLDAVEGKKRDWEVSEASQTDFAASEASDPAEAPVESITVLLTSSSTSESGGVLSEPLKEAVEAGNEISSQETGFAGVPVWPAVTADSSSTSLGEHSGLGESEVPEETPVVPQMIVELKDLDAAQSDLPAPVPTPTPLVPATNDFGLDPVSATPLLPAVDVAPVAGPETSSFAPLPSADPCASPSSSDSDTPRSSSPLSLSQTPAEPPSDPVLDKSNELPSVLPSADPVAPSPVFEIDTPVIPPLEGLPGHDTKHALISLNLPESEPSTPDTAPSPPHADATPVTAPIAASSTEAPESAPENATNDTQTTPTVNEPTPRKSGPVTSSSAPDLRSAAVDRPTDSANVKASSLTVHTGSVGSRMMNVAEENEMERLRVERASNRQGRRGAFYAPPPPAFRPKVGSNHDEVVNDPPQSDSGSVLPLSQVVSKTTKESKVSRRATVGWAETTGRRPTMEDAWMMFSQGKDASSLDLFGIFDGHRGDSAAKFAAENLPAAVTSVMRVSKNPSDWLRLGFLQTNLAMKQAGIATGTTAVVGMYWRSVVYLANAGDSRCVHGKVSPTGNVATRMTQDHKPERLDETERIVALGGEVHTSVNKDGKVVGRVNGQLGVSRALGDFDLEPYVIPDPEITQIDLLRPTQHGPETIVEMEEEEAPVASPSNAPKASSSGPVISNPAKASSSNSGSPSNSNALNTTQVPSRSPSGNAINHQVVVSTASSQNNHSQTLSSSSPLPTTSFTSSAPAATPMNTSSGSPTNPRASVGGRSSVSPGKQKPRPTSTTSKRATKDTIEITETTGNDRRSFDFLILACDGLWDVVTDEEAVDMAAHILQNGQTPEDAAKRLRNVAYGRNSTDNITVLIVLLQAPLAALKKSTSCIIL